MARGGFPELTLPVRAAYQADGTARNAFLAEVSAMTARAEKQFESSFGEIRRVVERSLASINGRAVTIDLGTSELRQAASEAELAVQRLRVMRDAAANLAERTGDTSRETHLYAQALRAQVIEAERAKSAADAQVTTYTRLQAEVDRTAAGQLKLADAYRATFLEQARSENAAFRAQSAVNARVSPTLAGARATDNGAGYGALAQMAAYEHQAAQLRATLDPAIGVQKRFDDELARARALFEAGAISAREYAQAQALARQNLQDGWSTLTRANGAAAAGALAYDRLADSTRGMRIATIGAGQQLQDIAISLAGGQRASLVFAQQLPQLGFALSSLEGNANKTLGRLGALGTTLSGPWGLAVVGATVLAGPLIDKLFGMSEASDKAARQAKRHTDVLDFQKQTTEQLTEAIRDQLALSEKAIQSEYAQAEAASRTAEQNLAKAIATREATKATLEAVRIAQAGAIEVPGVTDTSAGLALQKREVNLEVELKAQQTNIDSLRALQRVKDVVVGRLDVAANNDPLAGADRRYERDAGKLQNAYEHLTGIFKNAKDAAALFRAELDKLADRRDRDKAAAQAAGRAARSAVSETAAFAMPVAGTITSGFGPRARPTAGASRFHAAVDIAAPVGTPVRAPQVGVVEAVGFSPTLGKFVVLSHGAGTETRFGHLSDNSQVRKGDAVSTGDIIGKVGSTGISTGPHLDYQVKVNGKPVDPRRGRFPIDPADVAVSVDASQRTLDDFAEQAAERVARITEAFNEQPRAIDRAAAATRELQKIYKDLKDSNLLTPGASIGLAVGQAAIDDSLRRPFRNLLEEQERGLEIQRLTSAGRQQEAEVLQLQFRLMDVLEVKDRENLATALAKVGVGKAQYAQLVQNIGAARQLDREQQKFMETQRRQLDLIAGVRSNLTQTVLDVRTQGVGALGGFVTRLQDQFDSYFAENLVEKLFGGAFDSMEDLILKSKRAEADASITASQRLLDLADAADATKAALAGAAGASVPSNDNGDTAKLRASLNEIVVTGQNLSNPRVLVGNLATKIADTFLDKKTAERLGKGIGDALEGATYGRAASSLVVGKDANPLTSSIGGALGEVAGKKLLSSLGSFAGPLGGIVGGVLGGLVGGLFGKKPPSGEARLDGSSVTITGNDGARKKTASGLANNVVSGLDDVAKRLGGSVGSYLVSIGQYKDEFRVNYSGSDTHGKKTSAAQADRESFDSAEAAVRAALLNAVQDGAIQGLRAGSQAILKKAKDIDQGLQDALDFESIFTRLKAYTDPMGAALDTLDKEFGHLRGVAITAGEGMVELEELYGKERAKVIKETNDRILGSMRGLYDDLRTGDNGLSLRDRLAAVKEKGDPLLARVAAGDTSAYDEFAEVARQGLDITRQMYGSSKAYFDVFDALKDFTKSTIDGQSSTLDLAASRDSPFSSSSVPTNDNMAVVNAIENQTRMLLAGLGIKLDALNDNMGAVLNQQAAAGGGTTQGLYWQGYF